MKMRHCETESVVIIPDHKEVDRWTLKTILKQVEIPEEEFKRYL
ncbi:MAG: type II toxin-antitoxin system HicA family toxin [Deltaproteobacteria bacterium]|nr:type II toxin-antitoxin system HicA family toxin [Deltaproteobacteria bacterium]